MTFFKISFNIGIGQYSTYSKQVFNWSSKMLSFAYLFRIGNKYNLGRYIYIIFVNIILFLKMLRIFEVRGFQPLVW